MHNFARDAMHRLRRLHEALAPAPTALAAQQELPTPTPGSSDEWAAAHPHPSLGGASGLSDHQLNEWCSRGMVVLPEEQMGLPPGWHDRLRETALTAEYGMYDFCDVLPIGELLTAPGVEAGVASLLGPHWAVVPFANGSAGGNKRGPADGKPGGDQHWHKVRGPCMHTSLPLSDGVIVLARVARMTTCRSTPGRCAITAPSRSRSSTIRSR